MYFVNLSPEFVLTILMIWRLWFSDNWCSWCILSLFVIDVDHFHAKSVARRCWPKNYTRNYQLANTVASRVLVLANGDMQRYGLKSSSHGKRLQRLRCARWLPFGAGLGHQVRSTSVDVSAAAAATDQSWPSQLGASSACLFLPLVTSWHSHENGDSRSTRAPSYNFVFNTFFTISPKRQQQPPSHRATKPQKTAKSMSLSLPVFLAFITNCRVMAQSMKMFRERDKTHNWRHNYIGPVLRITLPLISFALVIKIIIIYFKTKCYFIWKSGTFFMIFT